MINAAHAQASWHWSLDQGSSSSSSKADSSSVPRAGEGVLQQRQILLFPIAGPSGLVSETSKANSITNGSSSSTGDNSTNVWSTADESFPAGPPPTWADTSLFAEKQPASPVSSSVAASEVDELASNSDDGDAQAESVPDDQERQHTSTSEPREALQPDGSSKTDAPRRKPGRRKRRPEDHFLTGPLTSAEKRAFRRLLKLSGAEEKMKRAEELQLAKKIEKGKGRELGERQDAAKGTIWVDGIEIVPSSSRETSPAVSEEEGEDRNQDQTGAKVPIEGRATTDGEDRNKAVTLTRNQQEEKLFLTLAGTLLPERDPLWLQMIADGTRLRDGTLRLPKEATKPSEPSSAPAAAPPPTRAANASVPSLLPLPAHWKLTPAQIAAREERKKARAHAQRARAVKESMESSAIRSSQPRSRKQLHRTRASNRAGSQVPSTPSRPMTPSKALSPTSRMRALARASPSQKQTSSLWSKIIGGLSWSKRVVASPWLQQYTAEGASVEQKSANSPVKRRGPRRRRKRQKLGTMEDGTEDEEYDESDLAEPSETQPRSRKRKRGTRESVSAARPVRSTRLAHAGAAKPWWMVDAVQQESPEPDSVEKPRSRRSIQRVEDTSESSNGDEVSQHDGGVGATSKRRQPLHESDEEGQSTDGEEEEDGREQATGSRRLMRVAAKKARTSGRLLDRPLHNISESLIMVPEEDELDPKPRKDPGPQATGRRSAGWVPPSARPSHRAMQDQLETSEDDDMDLLAGNSTVSIPQVTQNAVSNLHTSAPKHQPHRTEPFSERAGAVQPRILDSPKATKGVLRVATSSTRVTEKAAITKRVSFVPTSQSSQDVFSVPPSRPTLPPLHETAKALNPDDDFDALLPDPPAAVLDTGLDLAPAHPASAGVAPSQSTAEAQHAITRFALQPDVLGRLLQIRQLAQVQADGTDGLLHQRLTREQLAERLALISQIIDGDRPDNIHSPSPAKAHTAASAPARHVSMAGSPEASRLMGRGPPQAPPVPSKAAPLLSKAMIAKMQRDPPALGQGKRKEPSPSRTKPNGGVVIPRSAPSPSKTTETSSAVPRNAETPRASPTAIGAISSNIELAAEPAVQAESTIVSPAKSPRQQLAGRARREAAVKAAQRTSLQYKDPWAEGSTESATAAAFAGAGRNIGDSEPEGAAGSPGRRAHRDEASPPRESPELVAIRAGQRVGAAFPVNGSADDAATVQVQELPGRVQQQEQQQTARHSVGQEAEAGREKSLSPWPRTVLASTRSRDYSLALYSGDGSTQ